MDKTNRKVMVVHRRFLFPTDSDRFIGYRPKEEFDYLPRITAGKEFFTRWKVEGDDVLKQILNCVAIANPKKQKIYSCLRLGDNEKERWSIGIAGHIYEEDAVKDNRYKSPITIAMLRLAQSEVLSDAKIVSDLCGYINLEETAFDRSHFGLLYIALTQSESVRTRFRKTRPFKIIDSGLKSISELEELAEKGLIEPWSVVALEPVKVLLESVRRREEKANPI